MVVTDWSSQTIPSTNWGDDTPFSDNALLLQDGTSLLLLQDGTNFLGLQNG